MDNDEFVATIRKMNKDQLFGLVMQMPEYLIDSYYLIFREAIRGRYLELSNNKNTNKIEDTKIKITIDISSNPNSRTESIIDLSNLDITENEWKLMDNDSREDLIWELVHENINWSFEEIKLD